MVWMAERGSKTRKGMEGANEQQFNPKIFTTGTERCPVRSFKLFESHCPEKAKAPSYPFFLAINYRLVERRLLTIQFGKQASHGYLMVELRKIS